MPYFQIRNFTLVLFSLCFLNACGTSSSSTQHSSNGMKRAVPVTVTTAIQKTVPVQIQEIGNVQAYFKV